MSSTTLRRRILLVALVAISALPLLSSCGVTGWQRMMDAHADLNSPEMNARIAQAKAYGLHTETK
jgi:hypothetical protein